MQVGFLLAFFIISVVNLTFFICPSSSLVNQENEFLQDVFNFKPKRRYLNNNEHRMSSGEKVGFYD